METLSFQDYVRLLWREKKTVFVTALIVFFLGAAFSLGWDNYRAIATIEIVQPDVPDDVVTTGGALTRDKAQTAAEMRIGRLQQRVLSTGSLVEIITKFDLYADARRTTPVAEIAETMRKKIQVKFVRTTEKATPGQVLDPIAFMISFAYDQALLAQQVTNDLASRFLEADQRERREQAASVAAFLDGQIKVLESALADQEKKIAAFRAKNGDIRPEALAFNQQIAVSASMNLQNIESQLGANLGTQGSLKAQLAALDPYARVVGDNDKVLSSPSQMLKALRSEQASLAAKYGPKHPDVQKIARQVAALEKETSSPSVLPELKAKRDNLTAQLTAQEKTYGPQNPTIISLKKQVQALDRDIAVETAKPSAGGIPKDADNPAYLQIVAQLRAAEEQYKALLQQKQALTEQQTKFRHAVIQNPAVEQELAALTRDYENAQLRYRELKAKKMGADMAQTVEEDSSGQKLSVIDPPEVPLKTSPSRLLLLAASLLLAGMAGLGGAVLKHLAKPTVLGAAHLANLTGRAPLVVVPHIVTEAERTTISRALAKRLLVAGGLLIVGLILFALFAPPLDVVWAIAARRFSLF
jgi:uncharacterized protein involved in exopolysaccharide biosynthesis